jgi:hypothetical protein
MTGFWGWGGRSTAEAGVPGDLIRERLPQDGQEPFGYVVSVVETLVDPEGFRVLPGSPEV